MLVSVSENDLFTRTFKDNFFLPLNSQLNVDYQALTVSTNVSVIVHINLWIIVKCLLFYFVFFLLLEKVKNPKTFIFFMYPK